MKELEEIKCIVAIHFGALGFLNPSENEQILKDRDNVLNALNELKAIKESNPSEALKCLDDLFSNVAHNTYSEKYALDDYKTVKQTLLKQQEPKHYLKWEDLEFSKEYDTSFKVKLGDSIYTVTCSTQKFNNHIKYVAVETGLITYFIEELNKQFFNDLHLERVEE